MKGGSLLLVICSTDVFVSTGCDDDFYSNSFMAQQYWKPVLYHQVMQAERYSWAGTF